MPEISVDIESTRPVIAANLEELRYLVFHGMKGDTGDSAYELAVELGFEGTEQEWLASLRGTDGADGKDGKDGKDGADGKNYGIVVDGSVDNILELKSVEVDETPAVVAVSPVASNDPTKVAELVSVAQSYYDNRLDNGVSRFVYSQDYTIHNSDNIFVLGNIACNVFAGLVLRGIPYAESPYGVAYAAGMPKGTTYNEHYSEYTGLAAYSSNNLGYNNTYTWALNPWDWMSGSERDAETGRDVENKIANAAQLAQLLTEIGDVVPITEDYSYIEPGDFLFWATKGTGGVWRQPNRYLHISHVAVCTGIEEGKHAYIEVSKSAEDAGADSTVHKDYVETSTLHPKGRLALVCRPKLGRAVLTLVIVSQPQDIEARTGTSVVMSVVAKGEGLTYQWQYKNAGSSTWSDATASTAKTANYSFNVEANRDGRQIRCVVSAHGKSVNSRAATLRVIDTAPTANSDKLITSGGVYAALQNIPSGGGSGSASPWVALTSSNFGINSPASGGVSAIEAYYNENTGMVRFNFVVYGTASDGKLRCYFDNSKHYTPYDSEYGRSLPSTYYLAYPVGVASAVPVSTNVVASACILLDNTSGAAASLTSRVEICTTDTSTPSRYYVSGYYYTEDLPSEETEETGGEP